HGFTEKFFGDIGFSYEHNDYPTAITVAGKTDKREDNFFSGGIGASYELSEWFIFSLKYDYRVRTSNFSIYDFENNRISASLTGHF
ncbi:MAG: outer membrane beta-barrel protein, partial [Candidatus Omnitrophota bacterium]|nr:outer membrane beta-barrel protein [Candidatus Omnitrophota bacterium]